MSKNRNFVFHFYWGAEVRSFLHSGLIERLSRSHNVEVITRRIPAGAPQVAGVRTKWRLVGQADVSRAHSFLTSFANRAHATWVRGEVQRLAVADRAAFPWESAGGRSQFRNYLADLFAGPMAVQTLRIGEAILEMLDSERTWARALSDSPTSVLVSGDYLSAPGGSLIAYAGRKRWASVFYPLNWRDVYKGVRLQRNFDSWCFWNKDMIRIAATFNPWLDRGSLIPVGALQFDSHFRKDWLLSRGEFLSGLGLSPDRPVVCYSAVAEEAYTGESVLVEMVLDELQRIRGGGNIQFLIRLNPAGSDPNYAKLAAHHSGRVALYEPRLDGPAPPGPTWRAPTLADAQMFSNTIQHCCGNVGLASTVMMDFAVRGKPSVCMGFEATHSGSSRVADFLDQTFIEEAINRRVWPVAGTPGEMASLVLRMAEQRDTGLGATTGYIHETIGPVDGRAHERFVRVLEALASGSSEEGKA